MRPLCLALGVALAIPLATLTPAIAATGETSLFLRGEAGDFIVGDQTLFFTEADGSFTARRNASNGVSLSFVTPSFNHVWFIDVAAPGSVPLTVGTYEAATRWPLQAVTEPGLRVIGDGRACLTLTGRFEVKQVVYGPGDVIVSFWAIFEQHCENAAPATFGEIRYNAGADVVVIGPARREIVRGHELTFDVFATGSSGPVTLTAQNLPPGALFADHGDATGTFTWTPGFDQIGAYAVTFVGETAQGSDHATTQVVVNGVTSLFLRGDAGDVIVEGQQLHFTTTDGLFFVGRNVQNGVSIRFFTSSLDHQWGLDFAAPDSQALSAGAYEGASLFPTQAPGEPGLNVFGDGHACSSISGRFDVKETRTGTRGEIAAFWAVFEQHCNGAIPAASGEIRFNADAVDLVVTKVGAGQGTVNSDTPGIACGTGCQIGYRRTDAIQVALTAEAAPGSRFTGWAGSCTGTAACALTMTADHEVTATFEPLVPAYALSVTKAGNATGRVTSDQPGIDCGVTCSVQYLENATVVLTAVPDSGFAFAGWTGACSGTGVCTVTMSAARAVTATFVRTADLRVSAVSAPATVRTGQPLAITTTVTNAGTAVAGTFTVTFYLSAQQTPGSGTLVGSRTITTLAAGGNSSATTTVTIPLGFDPGTYFLSAVADSAGAMLESNELNNGLTAAGQVTVLMHRADLVMAALSAPASVRTGQPLSVASTVKNVGPAAAPGFRVTFYLSAGDNRPGAGTAIGSRSLASLAAAASSMATTPMTIPLGFEPGVYFLSAVVDGPNAVIEVDDRNNGLTANASVTVVMHRADLWVTAVTAPATGRTGQPLAVSSTVKNVGPLAAPAFRVTFYLSAGNPTAGAGTPIGSRTMPGLPAGGLSSVTTPLLIPWDFEPGTYFLSAVADDNNAVIEVSETNNGFTASSPVTILMFRPDLIVSSLTAPATARTGQPLAVTGTVKNIGQAMAPSFRVTFYLSATDSTPGAGQAVGALIVNGLAANASATTTTTVGIPLALPPGAYFLSAVADDNGAVIEVSDANNGLTASSVVNVLMFRADVTVGALSAPVAGRTGQPLPITHTIRNVGQVAAPSFRVTFYLSPTDTTPGAGLAIGSRTLPGLAAGMNSSAITPVKVPLGFEPGTYFLSAVVDDGGTVIEANESNNGLTAAAPVTIEMFRSDLSVTALTSPANGQTGRPLAVTSTVKNVGQFAAPAFRVTFYLGSDPAPGTGTPIGSRTVGGLPAGGMSTVTAPVTIPATGLAVGTYFLSAVATPTVATPEVTASNNGLTSLTPVAVELYRPDLTITNLTVPDAAAVVGRPFAVSATVRNVGPAPASAFRIAFYLVSSGTPSPSAALLGSQSVGSLAANASFTTTLPPTVPATVPPGQYFVIAVVDDLGKVIERAEGNNSRVRPTATAVVPLIVRTYAVTVTSMTSACTDPNFNHSDTGPVTLKVPTQNGGAFSATAGFTTIVQGVTVVTTYTFSGNVTSTRDVNGAFTVKVVGGGQTLLQGNGTFAGSVNGAALSATLTGSLSVATGATCTLTASVSP